MAQGSHTHEHLYIAYKGLYLHAITHTHTHTHTTPSVKGLQLEVSGLLLPLHPTIWLRTRVLRSKETPHCMQQCASQAEQRCPVERLTTAGCESSLSLLFSSLGCNCDYSGNYNWWANSLTLHLVAIYCEIANCTLAFILLSFLRLFRSCPI